MATDFCFTAGGALATGTGPVLFGERLQTDKLASLLVACCGQLEYTRLCVPSLLRHSRPPYELLFLDALSLDGTAEYLAGIADASPVRVEVVRVAHPTAPAELQGSEVLQVRGDFVALVNNDTVVTAGWLERLATLAEQDATIGLVAPMSNYAPPPLLVAEVPFRIDAEEPSGKLAALDGFARAWAEQHRGQWCEAERLGGGCVLVKRQVLQTLGLFPTRTALGAFDIEALGQRARQAGYRLAVAEEVFVYHFGARHPVRG
jgi:O-antigen biosynthesis protein